MKKVLVVDDSRIMRNIVKNTFNEMKIPCEYLEAANGNEALLKIHTQNPDLVLLDWNMPELSGIELLKKVRANPLYRDLPIVMITSESARYSVIEALKYGATDYIIKPVNERTFIEKLARLSL
ncbi:chemotaxis protein CheY [Spirochaetia bacterium]|nr:chemotaxis protein CheY [Spirochaetia bacterium]